MLETTHKSTKAKDVESRFKLQGQSFTELLTEDSFLDACKLAEAEQLFIHLKLNKVFNKLLNQNSCPILVIDIDSKRNGQLVQKLFIDPIVQDLQPTVNVSFVNKTPRGYHFFFLNTLGRKNRVYNKILGLGIVADFLPREWVTILGKGYNLLSLRESSLVLGPVPFFLYPVSTKNTTRVIVNGEFVQGIAKALYRKHFQITRKVRTNIDQIRSEMDKWSNKIKIQSQVFLECGFIFLNNFDFIPDGLAELLCEFGFVGPNPEPTSEVSSFWSLDSYSSSDYSEEEEDAWEEEEDETYQSYSLKPPYTQTTLLACPRKLTQKKALGDGLKTSPWLAAC